MIIRLRVYGQLERHLGCPRLEVELPAGAAYRDLLDAIGERWGTQLPLSLWDAEARRFRGGAMAMTGGSDLHDEGAPLYDGQEIVLLLPLAGGSDP